jgi:hypothetical protein
VIGRETLQTGGSWELNWSGRPTVNVNADDRKTLTFRSVKADDISDSMTIRVATVNGTAAETAARNGVLQIRAITRSQFDRNNQWRFAKGELQGFVNNDRTPALLIPDTIWGEPVISIGNGAFRNAGLTRVVIPNSVTAIGDEAFSDNKLTGLTIGSSVASIGSKAFWQHSLSSITFPASVISIGEEAFLIHSAGPGDYRQITSIAIGANVVMARSAFEDSYYYTGDGGSQRIVSNAFQDYYYRNNKKAGNYTRGGASAILRSLFGGDPWSYSP